jgi:hypothetical protein
MRLICRDFHGDLRHPDSGLAAQQDQASTTNQRIVYRSSEELLLAVAADKDMNALRHYCRADR